MANSLLTIQMITREALRVLVNNLVFTKNVNREYSKEFSVTGAKIGNTLNVRLPNRYYVSKTSTLVAQSTTETSTPLTLNTQWQVGLQFTQNELTLSLDDFSKRVLTPAMSRLGSQIDQDGLSLAKDVYNQVGTPGVTPGTPGGTGIKTTSAPQIFLNAGAQLDFMATPRDESRRAVLNPSAMAGSVAGLSGLFNDQGTVGDQYKHGVLGHALGLEFAMDQNVNNLSTGSHAGSASAVVMGAEQSGSRITTDGWTVSQSGLLTVGEVFSITGVNSVNPDNQQDTGQLASFVVTDNTGSNSSGQSTISISPPIVLAGPSVANGTVASLPADNAPLILGSGNPTTSYPMNIAYHQDAFTMATADLEMPRGVDMAAREVYDGVSMLIVRAYDINTSNFYCRVDVLGGWKTLRPELACRITG